MSETSTDINLNLNLSPAPNGMTLRIVMTDPEGDQIEGTTVMPRAEVAKLVRIMCRTSGLSAPWQES